MRRFPLIRFPELTRLTWSHVDRLFDAGNDNADIAEHERNVRMIATALCRQEQPGMELEPDFRKAGIRHRPAVSCDKREDYLRRAREMLEICDPLTPAGSAALPR